MTEKQRIQLTFYQFLFFAELTGCLNVISIQHTHTEVLNHCVRFADVDNFTVDRYLAHPMCMYHNIYSFGRAHPNYNRSTHIFSAFYLFSF